MTLHKVVRPWVTLGNFYDKILMPMIKLLPVPRDLEREKGVHRRGEDTHNAIGERGCRKGWTANADAEYPDCVKLTKQPCLLILGPFLPNHRRPSDNVRRAITWLCRVAS
jgi:hypothetical protein